MTKLKIEYWGEQDSELDFQFDEIARNQGLFFDGSGYDVKNKRRDITYTSD